MADLRAEDGDRYKSLGHFVEPKYEQVFREYLLGVHPKDGEANVRRLPGARLGQSEHETKQG